MNTTAATAAMPMDLDLSWIYRSEAFAEDLAETHPPVQEFTPAAAPSSSSASLLRGMLRAMGSGGAGRTGGPGFAAPSHA